jgi:hypothetical protein
MPDFQLYYRVTVIKTAWLCHPNKHGDQEINIHHYRHLILEKGGKKVKTQPLQQMVMGKLDIQM